MSVALAVFGVALGLLVASLAVPVELAFECQGVEPMAARVRVAWLFGSIRFRFAVPRVARRSPDSQPPAGDAPRVPAARPGKPSGNRGRVWTVLRQSEFRQRVLRLIQDLLRAVRVHRLRLQMRIGLGDPAETGWLWAWVAPLAVAARGRRNVQVRIEPDFIDAALAFEASGRVRFVPLRLLALAIGFAFSPPSLHAWRTLAGHG